MRNANHSDNDVMFDNSQPHLQQLLAGFPFAARAATACAEDFWERQRLEIRKRIAAQGRQPLWGARALAGAFTLVLVAIFMLQNGSAPTVSRSDMDSDQELYLAVEQAVQSNGPDALAPATILADEIVSSDRTY